jgi:hypothetical protein
MKMAGTRTPFGSDLRFIHPPVVKEEQTGRFSRNDLASSIGSDRTASPS